MIDPRLKSRATVVEERQQRIAGKTAKAKKRGVKVRNEKRHGHRFASGVIDELRDFVRHLPCLIAGFPEHRCVYDLKKDLMTGEPFRGSDPAHIEPEARGEGDLDNLVPLCRTAHRIQEGRNKYFEATYGVRLASVARQVTAKWIRETKAGL